MYCLFYVILQIGLILVPGVHFYDESEEKFNMEGNQSNYSAGRKIHVTLSNAFFPTCCGLPVNTFRPSRKCKNEWLPSDEPASKLSSTVCESECVHLEYGNIDDDGNMIKPKVLKFMELKLGSRFDFRFPTVEKAYDSCIQEVKHGVMKKYKEKIPTCNILPFGLILCLLKYVEMDCPEAKQVDSRLCTQLRNHIKLNDDLFSLGRYRY